MMILRWLCMGTLLATWSGCGGSAVTESDNGTGGGSTAGGGGSATGGSASGGTSTGGSGDAGCHLSCISPPPGCHYEGSGSCNPPACPPLVCEDASIGDASEEDATCLIDCAPPPNGCHYVGEPTCNPPTCPPMECVDAGTAFPAVLDGIWLIGWSGGMNHFSWVRFTGEPNWGGDAIFLAGDDLPANAPFWNCNGTGAWMVTEKPDTIGINFPDACGGAFSAYTFVSFDNQTSMIPDAVLHATIQDLTASVQYIDGFKFPPSQCDAAMTTCQNPWQH